MLLGEPKEVWCECLSFNGLDEIECPWPCRFSKDRYDTKKMILDSWNVNASTLYIIHTHLFDAHCTHQMDRINEYHIILKQK